MDTQKLQLPGFGCKKIQKPALNSKTNNELITASYNELRLVAKQPLGNLGLNIPNLKEFEIRYSFLKKESVQMESKKNFKLVILQFLLLVEAILSDYYAGDFLNFPKETRVKLALVVTYEYFVAFNVSNLTSFSKEKGKSPRLKIEYENIQINQLNFLDFSINLSAKIFVKKTFEKISLSPRAIGRRMSCLLFSQATLYKKDPLYLKNIDPLETLGEGDRPFAMTIFNDCKLVQKLHPFAYNLLKYDNFKKLQKIAKN